MRTPILLALLALACSTSPPSIDDAGSDAFVARDASLDAPRAVDAGADAGVIAAPTDLVMTAQGASGCTLAWRAPAGVSVDHYRIYRNGASYDVATGATYSDTNAPGTQVPALDAPATAYAYAVAAVDAAGHESARVTQCAVWGFRGADGGSRWGDSDYSYGLASLDWHDTSGVPVGGGTDVHLQFHDGNGGGFQPYSNQPQVPTYDLELGAFRFFTFDLRVEHAENDFFIGVLSRFPFGDVYGWEDVRVRTYATPRDDAWVTVRIPLEDLRIGTTPFTGSIGAPYGTFMGAPYATLTVTAVEGGAGVDTGGFVLGTGLTGGVLIVEYEQRASIGTFHVQGPGITSSTTVASRAMTYQRTNMYKFDLGLNDGEPGGAAYMNNFGFTTE